MNAKQITKIFCDIAMTVTFLLLVLGVGSTVFHEVLGISVALLYVLHLILNFSWIKHIFKTDELSRKDNIYLTLDIMLLVGMIVIIVTGILISQVIFSFENNNLMLCSDIHHVASYITLGVMGAHIGIHLEYLIAFIGRTAKNLFKKPGLKVLSGTASVIAAFFIVYSMISSAYQGKLNEQTPTFPVYENQPTQQETTQEEKKTAATTQSTTESTAAAPTLNEFLSKLYCTGCGRHCPLLSPQCQKGASQAQEAELEYNNEYSSN